MALIPCSVSGISIPIDARSISRSVYTSGALPAWVEVFWIPSRTHQHEPDGAIGFRAEDCPCR